MNFCLDTRTATEHFPGIGRYASNLAWAMADKMRTGEKMTLIQDANKTNGLPLPISQSGRVNVLDVSMSCFGLRQQYALAKHLRRLQVDTYHSPYFLMPYLPRKPTAVTIHDLIPLRFPAAISLRARLFFQASIRMALWAADEVITPSEASRQDLLKAYSLESHRVTTIPMAPAQCFTPQSSGEILRVRQKYAIEDYVLYLGINKPHKNLLGLLDAWKKIDTNALLVIAGRWDKSFQEPKNRVKELALDDHVLFLDAVDERDLPGLYAGAKLFVFPSLHEGFGLPVIEAMACGTAVACSNVSSLPEVAGDAARFFNPHDTDEIISAISSILETESLRLKLQEEGLLRAAKFSWSRTAEMTLGVYRRLHESLG